MRTFQLVSIATLSLLAACGDTVKNYYVIGADGGIEEVEVDAGEDVGDVDGGDPVEDAGLPAEDDDEATEEEEVDAGTPEPTPPEPTPPADFCENAANRAPLVIANGRMQFDVSWISKAYRSHIEICGNFTGMSWTSCVTITDTDGDGRPDYLPPAADLGRTCINFTYRSNEAVWALYGAQSGRCVGLMTTTARAFIWRNTSDYSLSITPNGLTGCSNL